MSFSKKHIKYERRLKINDVIIKFCPLKNVKKSGIRIEHMGLTLSLVSLLTADVAEKLSELFFLLVLPCLSPKERNLNDHVRGGQCFSLEK